MRISFTTLLLVLHVASHPFIELKIDPRKLTLGLLGVELDVSLLPPEFRIHKNVLTAANSNELFFYQNVDHFSTKNVSFSKATFRQRYYVNDEFYKPGGPAFLHIGGEEALSSLWVQKSILVEAAQRFNGVVYALEHRYYGKSQPFSNLSTRSLRFLNAQQAIMDIRNFILKVPLPTTRYEVDLAELDRPKWVIVGGSYPGNLAAWLKQSYPNLINGAIASSAPFLIKENFYEYDLQVQYALANKGGSGCRQLHVEVIEYIDKVLTSFDRTRIGELKDKFGCKHVDDLLFADGLTFVSGIVQYNSDLLPNNITDYCNRMNPSKTLAQKLNSFVNAFKRHLGNKTCEEYVDVEPLKKIELNDDMSLRQWLYQCCNEFGYWQIAPPPSITTARSRLPNVDYYHKLYCTSLFGQFRDPKSTNLKFKARKLRTTNLAITNGSLDPWLPLSITRNETDFPKGMSAYLIHGASHADDIFKINTNDPPNIKAAKLRNLKLIEGWIQ